MSNRIPYRLALDLGTNSIGWCLLDLNGDGDPCAIRRMGVRIFPDGRDPKSKESLAADRRLARSMRRRRDRYLRRRSALMNALVSAGLMPADRAERKALQLLDPYDLRARARALTQPLSAGQLGRALFHLNQRRGFKSNRKAGGDENESGKIKAGISVLKSEIAAGGEATLGAWLAARHAKRQTVRARLDGVGAKAAYPFYPDRQLVQDEFAAIREVQAPHHPDLSPADWDRIESIIFRQRPLRPVRPGKCTLFPEEERAPWALPIAQHFRILTELGNLRLYRPGEEPGELTPEQHAQLFAKLSRSADLTFEKLKKELKLPSDFKLNLEGEKRDRLKGDATTQALGHKKRFGQRWHSFTADDQREVVARLIETENETELAAWLETAPFLAPENAAYVAASSGLPDGYCRLSEKALREVVPLMRDRRLRYDEAVRALGLHHSDFRPDPDHLPDLLPYYGEPLERFIAFGSGEPADPPEIRLGRFPNPTVHIGLNELRKLVNKIVERWGKPADIVVELARDLKRSRDERDALQRDQAANQRKNEQRAARIRELGIEPRPDSILRLRLWEELLKNGLGHVCVYTGEPISITRLLQGDVDIDHILPFSRTLSDGADNKIVCVRHANRFKRNRSPWEAFGAAPVEGYDWAGIAARAEELPGNKRWRFLPDAMDRFAEGKDFLDRQLVETRHLSRIARQYLGSILPLEKVRVAPGKLTAMLRARWGLNKILSDGNLKNRSDHRHHAIDAAVLGVIDQRLVQLVAQAAARAEVNELERLFDGLPDPFEGLAAESFGNQVREKVRGIVVSHKAEHGWQGRMHNDTAYGPVAVRDGVHTVVTRKPLSSLTPKDFPGIRDTKLAEALEAHVAAEARAGRTAAEAINSFTWCGQPVRRVRVLEVLGNPIPIRDPAGAIFKVYKGDSNAWYEILRDSRGRWTGRIVSTFEAYRLHRDWLAETGANPARGGAFLDWAGKRIAGEAGTPLFRIFKGDLLAIGEAPDRRIMRVVKFSEGVIAMALHLEGGNLKARDADKGDPFNYLRCSPDSLRKQAARPAGVDLLGYVHDKGPLE